MAFYVLVIYQNNPTILASSFTSIAFAEGTFGSPGIVIALPQTSTINSAPAASCTSQPNFNANAASLSRSLRRRTRFCLSISHRHANRHSARLPATKPPENRTSARVCLTHPHPRIAKHLHPRALVFPRWWMPRQINGQAHALRVRHHDRDAAVGRGEGGHTER